MNKIMKEEKFLLCSVALALVVMIYYWFNVTEENRKTCSVKCGSMESFYEHGNKERSKCFCIDQDGEFHLKIIF